MIQWLSIKLVNVCFNQPDAILSVVATILLHLLIGLVIAGTTDEAKQIRLDQILMLHVVFCWEIYIIVEEVYEWHKPNQTRLNPDWRRPKSVEQLQNTLFHGPGRGVGQIPNRHLP